MKGTTWKSISALLLMGDDGEIIEENLFYDVVGMMQQLGIG